MDERIIAILVIIGVMLVIIIAFVVWGATTTTKNGSTAAQLNEAVLVRPGQMLQPCPCASGLVCDGNSFVCKRSLGQPCSNYGDCAAGNFCSGVCVYGPTGGLDQYCPCSSEYVCVTVDESGLKECKGNTSACTKNSDCASLQCVNGFCNPGLPLAYPCTVDSQCSTNFCSEGYCQEPGVTSYNKGAACSGKCVEFNGSGCLVNDNMALVCACLGGQGVPGTCVLAQAGLAEVCSASTLCSGLYGCYNTSSTSGQTACSEGDSCLCKFTYEDPNTVTDAGCIVGMASNNGLCYNNLRFGCENISQCSSGLQCSGPPIIAYYSFSTAGLNYVGSQDVEMAGYSIPLSQFISGTGTTMQIIRIFAGLNSNSFYVVDSNYGLLYFDGIGTWSQVLTAISSKGSLVDAAFRRFQTPTAVAMFSSSGYSVVYSGSAFTNLSPFNPTSGPGPSGTQYDNSNNAISGAYIDISNTFTENFDVLLVTSSGVVYVKSPTDTRFAVPNIVGGPKNGTALNNIYGPARFYYDEQGNSLTNIGFVAPWTLSTGKTVPQMLQFSGVAAGPPSGTGLAMPVDIYGNLYYNVYRFEIFNPNTNNPSTAGFANSSVIMLSQALTLQGDTYQFSNATISYQGNISFMPYQLGSNFVPGISSANYLISSAASCAR